MRGTAKGEYETESVAVDFWETLFWGAIDGLAEMASKGFDIILANPDYLYFGKFVMNKMMKQIESQYTRFVKEEWCSEATKLEMR